MINFKQWDGFEGRMWKEEVNTRDFIQHNYKPYDGDSSFLEGPTEATDKLWGILQDLQKKERAQGGILDMETEVVSTLTAYGPGYINEETNLQPSMNKLLKRLLVFRQISHLREHLCLSVVLRWLNRLVQLTVTHLTLSSTRSSTNTAVHITKVYSMLTHRK